MNREREKAMFAGKKRNFHLPLSSSMKTKIINSQWGYTSPKIPVLANFVNKNYPEWNMQIKSKSKFRVGRTMSSGVRLGEGHTSKGFEITFTKNGKEVNYFDTSYSYTNKDVARFITKEIIMDSD